jgi:cytochrome c5
MKFTSLAVAANLASAALASGAAGAQAQPPSAALKSGEQVYKETCAACHAAGLLKAPKLGDKKDWAPLIRESQPTLTADGWVGVREMPPKGGKTDLGLEEFARAVAYMARAAGAKWQDPDAAMMKRIRDAEKKALDKKSKAAAKK